MSKTLVCTVPPRLTSPRAMAEASPLASRLATCSSGRAAAVEAARNRPRRDVALRMFRFKHGK